jgi:thiamine biosynthesis lipoprotein
MKPLRALHYIMGTLLDCTLFDFPTEQGRCLLSQGVHEVRRLERLLSLHDPDSALSHLNRQAGCGPVQVAPELWQLLCLCAALTQQTDGAFDVSAKALTCHELAALSRVSCHVPRPAFNLSADGWVELAPGACLDLGGIGKGYAVDRLVEMFQAAGVSRAFINFGESSLYTLGVPPHARGWPILVRGLAPEAILGVLWCENRALSTSHSLGKRLATGASHILDSRTGLPLQHSCLSTILAPSATLAEALSTAVLVSGAGWTELLTRFPETEGLYVGPDRVLHCTIGLGPCFQPYSEVL